MSRKIQLKICKLLVGGESQPCQVTTSVLRQINPIPLKPLEKQTWEHGKAFRLRSPWHKLVHSVEAFANIHLQRDWFCGDDQPFRVQQAPSLEAPCVISRSDYIHFEPRLEEQECKGRTLRKLTQILEKNLTYNEGIIEIGKLQQSPSLKILHWPQQFAF